MQGLPQAGGGAARGAHTGGAAAAIRGRRQLPRTGLATCMRARRVDSHLEPYHLPSRLPAPYLGPHLSNMLQWISLCTGSITLYKGRTPAQDRISGAPPVGPDLI